MLALVNPALQLSADAVLASAMRSPVWGRVILQSYSSSMASWEAGSVTYTATAADAAADGTQQQPAQQPELVDQFLAAVNSSRRQQLAQRKPDIMQEYQRADGDVGSPEVQIALLTEKIRDMTTHFQTHRKDHHSMRGLQGMLNQRRKFLAYLRRSNFERYAFALHKLGLKDTYAKQERYDKYRVGTRLGVPAEALKRYGNK